MVLILDSIEEDSGEVTVTGEPTIVKTLSKTALTKGYIFQFYVKSPDGYKVILLLERTLIDADVWLPAEGGDTTTITTIPITMQFYQDDVRLDVWKDNPDDPDFPIKWRSKKFNVKQV